MYYHPPSKSRVVHGDLRFLAHKVVQAQRFACGPNSGRFRLCNPQPKKRRTIEECFPLRCCFEEINPDESILQVFQQPFRKSAIFKFSRESIQAMYNMDWCHVTLMILIMPISSTYTKCQAPKWRNRRHWVPPKQDGWILETHHCAPAHRCNFSKPCLSSLDAVLNPAPWAFWFVTVSQSQLCGVFLWKTRCRMFVWGWRYLSGTSPAFRQNQMICWWDFIRFLCWWLCPYWYIPSQGLCFQRAPCQPFGLSQKDMFIQCWGYSTSKGACMFIPLRRELEVIPYHLRTLHIGWAVQKLTSSSGASFELSDSMAHHALEASPWY